MSALQTLGFPTLSGFMEWEGERPDAPYRLREEGVCMACEAGTPYHKNRGPGDEEDLITNQCVFCSVLLQVH